jgi:hypothetical protein
MVGNLPLLTSVLMILTLKAQALTRLDSFSTDDNKRATAKVHLFMTQNCSVCQKQVETLRSCLDSSMVAAYLDGLSEEKLMIYVKRKAIPFQTYQLNPASKSELKFGSVSPSLTFFSDGKVFNQEGYMDCEQINKELKADSSGPRR